MIQWGNSLGSILGATTTQGSTNTGTDCATSNLWQYYPSQLAINNQQNAYGQLAQQAHVFGQAYGIVAELPEKVFKTAKGFLAELREEIDAWHGDCLRV